VPGAVTADGGYGQPAFERDLLALGVRTVAIPRQGKISPARKTIEHHRRFRRLVKWRTGSEGRISYLKHTYGWDRTRLDGRHGAGSGAAAGYSPTTSSRSEPWPDDHTKGRPRLPALPGPPCATSAQGLFQVEVVTRAGRVGAGAADLRVLTGDRRAWPAEFIHSSRGAT